MLINNAGIMPIGPFVEETDATAQRMVDINLHGVILGSKLAIERFLPRRRGHLVQIASAAGKFGIAGGATYCATKHAVVGLSEALAMELRDTGIDISVVMPTVVNTELGSGLPSTRAFKAVEPEDVANAIVEALQTGRFDVYVPKSLNGTVRMGSLLPAQGDGLHRARAQERPGSGQARPHRAGRLRGPDERDVASRSGRCAPGRRQPTPSPSRLGRS